MRVRYRRFLVAALLLAPLAGLSTGCEGDFVRNEARNSLASFIIGVVTTAVNGSIAAD